MPNIPQFNATDRTPFEPTSRGSEAFAMEGRRVGAFYHQIGQVAGQDVREIGGDVTEHLANQEILQGGAAAAKMLNGFSDAWNTTAKSIDPNDHTAVQQFRDQMEPTLEQFEGSFHTEKGQLWAKTQVQSIRQHMYEKTASDASTLAGIAAVQNVDTTTNSLAAAAHGDITTLDTALGTVRSVAEAAGSSPNMSADTAARVKGELFDKAAAQLTMSAMRGAIERNPDAGGGLVDSDPRSAQYLDETQRNELRDYASRQKSAQLVDQERQSQLLEKQAREASTARASQYLTALGTTDTSSSNFLPTWNKSVLTDPNLLPAERDSLQAMGERMVRQGAEAMDRGSVPAFDSLVHDVAGGKQYTDAQIYGMVKPGGLSVAQAETAIRIARPKTPRDELDTKMLDADMQLWRAQYPQSVGGMPNPANVKAYNDAVTFYLPLIKQGLDNGIPMSQLLAPPNYSDSSIYKQRTIESFNPTPAAHAGQLHPTAPQSNIWDAVTNAWNQFRDMGSGGAAVRTPIEGPIPQPPPTLAPDRAAALNAIFSGSK